MKLEKRTKSDEVIEKRWYDDACGTAVALEFMGERWSLLVMRELMLGARRFSDIRADLPGISANVLTQRLAGLERAGIVTRRRLGPPLGVQVYDLTPWGREAEPVLQTMGRWATRSPLHDPTRPFSPVSAMLSLRTMIRPGGGYPPMTLGFHFPTAQFVGRLKTDELMIERSDAADADAVFETDPAGLAMLVYGKQPFADAQQQGRLVLHGDAALAQAFVDLFALPPKVA